MSVVGKSSVLSRPSCVASSSASAAYRSASSQFPARHSSSPRFQSVPPSPRALVPCSARVEELEQHRPCAVELDGPDELVHIDLGRSRRRTRAANPASDRSSASASSSWARGRPRPARNCQLACTASARQRTPDRHSARPRARPGRHGQGRARRRRPQRIIMARRRWMVASRVASSPSPPTSARRYSSSGALRASLDARELDEDLGELGAGCSLGSSPLEQGGRATAVPSRVVPVGGEEDSASRVAALVDGREPERLLGQLGGGGRRAALCAERAAASRTAAIVVVGLGGGEREVPGSLLRRRNERCEPCVQSSSARRGLARGDRGAEQRVGESQALAVQLEDRALERLGEPGVRDAEQPPRRGRWSARRPPPRRCSHLEGRGAEAVEALAEQLVEGRRDRQRVAGRRRAAASLQRAGELEREERVSRRTSPRA